jgi:hypothetical protein
MAASIIFLTILSFILWICLSIVYWSIRNGISPMPTSGKVERKILEALPPETRGTIIDLGSGWGSMAIQFAKQHPNCQVIGCETSPIPYLFSKLWLKTSGLQNLRFYRKDFFTVPLNDISLIYCYLYPAAMKALTEKFERETLPGTVVVTNTFAIHNWTAIDVVDVQDLYNTKIYIYKRK